MNFYLLEMLDVAHPITQKVEIWANETPSPELLNAKALELVKRFIRSDRKSAPLEQQPDAGRIYYSPFGDALESPTELAYIGFSCTEYPNGFTLRDRNATIEQI